MSYVVVVTRGVARNQPYVTGIRTMADARKLRAAAYARGYKDARIEDEAYFRETQEAARRRSADARSAA